MITSSAIRADDRVGPRGPSLVVRPALFALLSASATGGVTLVCAPAGSGKTVLLRSWIEHAGLAARVAWVSVDRGEKDAQRFWQSVVERLREVETLERVVQNVTPSPDFDVASFVQQLVAQLASLEEPVVLVIDDVHELHSPEALAQLERLLARRPPRLHVVLASRHDPQLGLHRLRLTGQLTELRESDLRFTLAETRELLAGAGVMLSTQSLGQLHQRTEGWVAGLRLAAISLARHPAPEQFVAEFAGSERTVAEYLLAEVLEQQPAAVRRLLLRTSILDRVNGALADVLVGSTGSERVLQELEAANAFVVSLDAGRSWFRYHHLFADLLRLELRRTEPAAVIELHRLAAGWYAAHGYVVEAVRHAQTAEDWSQAARLLIGNGLTLWLNGQEETLAGLIAVFPADAPQSAELALLFGYREMTGGSLDSATAYLALAERQAAEVADDRKRRFDIALAVTSLTLARRRGDFGSVLHKVQALLGRDDLQAVSEVELSNEARAAALMNLGIVELWAYRLAEAAGHLEQGLQLARRVGLAYVEVGCLSHLATIDAWRSFAAVRERCAQTIGLAEAHGLSHEPIVCVALSMMALMDVAQARFESAQDWLTRAEATLRPDVEPATALLLHRARGMLHYSRGRLEQALATFRAAERLQSLLVTPHALTAQMREWLVLTLLRIGRFAEAREALGELSDDERHWGEARTAQASLHLAEGDPRAALEVLGAVLDGSAPVLHSGSLVEALLVHAIAHARLGESHAAESDVERALEIAEPESQMFPFVLVRPTDLLQQHPRQRTAHAALLSDVLDVLTGATVGPRPTHEQTLHEALSHSELRVLGYLPSNLSAPEIANELCVSTSTVKTHMRQIYAKLDAHTRTEAVERARLLKLLGSPSRAQR